MIEEPAVEVTPVIEFRDVTITPRRRFGRGLRQMNLRLIPGELVLIYTDRVGLCPPVADAAQGLLLASSGTVEFEGHSWRTMRPAPLSRARSHIGRVFDLGGWVSNLDVVENVILARRHHNWETVDELRRRADEVAKTLGLTEVPRERPSDVSPLDLRRAQWVRALLSQPVLLLLERPTRGVSDDAMRLFRPAVESALRRGAAVIWITSDERDARLLEGLAKRQYELFDQDLKPHGGTAA